jgi:hypothetical protein
MSDQITVVIAAMGTDAPLFPHQELADLVFALRCQE